MEMVNGLTGIRTAVGHHTVAAGEVLGSGDLGNHRENVGNHLGIIWVHVVAVGNVRLGHHQNVGRCLGRNVPEGIAQFVLVNLGAGDIPGDNFTE